MNHTEFPRALAEIVDVLAALPRERGARDAAVATARDAFAAYPALAPRIIVDQPPGSPQVEYDVLLQRPEGGSIAVSWRPDASMPWALVHSDHWAANYVLTVGTQDVPVQDALLFLRMHAERYPDLMQDMLDGQLVIEALAADPPPVSDAEMQHEADMFRRARGLLTAEATQRWLRDSAVDEAGFRDFLLFRIRERKFFAALADTTRDADLVLFAAELERIDVLWVHGPADTLARVLARGEALTAVVADALAQPEDDIEFERVALFACDAPEAFSGAATGTVIGPIWWRERRGVVQVLRRVPAVADERTFRRMHALRRRAWLDARREEVEVYWHWF